MIRVTEVDNFLSDPVIRWADQRLEGRYNKCHAPDSGQFCSGGGGISSTAYKEARKSGGITIDLEGNRPTEGYAYAPNKDTETPIPLNEFTPEDIDNFIDEHYDDLSQKGNHLGLWTQDDTMYLDVTQVGPPTADTIEKAQGAEQLAVFDLKTFTEVPTGKIGSKGYERTGEAADLHSKHQREVEGSAESRSAPGISEVPRREEARTAVSDFYTDPVFNWVRYNECHSPDSGQFCSGSGAGAAGGGGAAESDAGSGGGAPISPEMRRTFGSDAAASIDKAYTTVTTKYPNAAVEGIRTDTVDRFTAETHNNEYFHSVSGDVTSRRESAIIFDPSMADSEALTTAWRQSIADGYHPPAGPDNDAYAAITTHELGHVLEFQRAGDAGIRDMRDQAEKTLRGLWTEHNNTAPEEMQYADFGNWVHEYVSGYAAPYNNWGGGFSAKPNMGEALAEAFQDVEMNGPSANPANVVLHRLLTRGRKF